MNIALVSGVVASLSVRLVGHRNAARFSTIAIATYTLFVGAGGAVVRGRNRLRGGDGLRGAMGCVAVWVRTRSVCEPVFSTGRSTWERENAWNFPSRQKDKAEGSDNHSYRRWSDC